MYKTLYKLFKILAFKAKRLKHFAKRTTSEGKMMVST